MSNPYSTGKDFTFIPPGGAGSVLTSNGPNALPSYQGGGQTGVTPVSGNYSALLTDGLIEALGPNNQTITLPVVGVNIGAEFTVVVSGQGTPIVVNVPSSNINGVSSLSLTTRYSALTVKWDGTQYVIQSLYAPAAETVSMDKWTENFTAIVNRTYPSANYQTSGGVLEFFELAPGRSVDKFEPHYPDIINRIAARAPDLWTEIVIDASLLTKKEAMFIDKFQGEWSSDFFVRAYPLAVYVASGAVRVPLVGNIF